jgi:hypothetical protein
VGADQYEAVLPSPATPTTTEYYLHAEDGTGRSEGMPRTEPAGWYSFSQRPSGVGVSTVSDARRDAVVPNPFRTDAAVSFRLHHPGPVRVDVIDARGRLVRNLVAREFGAGPSTVVWDGRDEGGNGVAPGSYYVRLTAAGITHVRPVVRVD